MTSPRAPRATGGRSRSPPPPRRTALARALRVTHASPHVDLPGRGDEKPLQAGVVSGELAAAATHRIDRGIERAARHAHIGGSGFDTRSRGAQVAVVGNGFRDQRVESRVGERRQPAVPRPRRGLHVPPSIAPAAESWAALPAPILGGRWIDEHAAAERGKPGQQVHCRDDFRSAPRAPLSHVNAA